MSKLDKIVTLFGPHPGMLGCPEPLPHPVQVAAKTLTGQRMLLKHALEAISQSAQDIPNPRLEPICVELVHNCIMLTMGTYQTQINCWRVLRYED